VIALLTHEEGSKGQESIEEDGHTGEELKEECLMLQLRNSKLHSKPVMKGFLAIEEKRLKMEEQMMGELQCTVALVSGFIPQYSQLFYTAIPPLQAMPPSSGSQSKDQCDLSKDRSFAS